MVGRKIKGVWCLLLFVSLYSQRKSRTWRNSLRSWEESKSIFHKLTESQSRRTRRATPPSSSLELQNIFWLLRLMIRTKPKKLCNPSHQTSRKRPKTEMLLVFEWRNNTCVFSKSGRDSTESWRYFWTD